MTEREVRERDILVAPNEYAYVQDLTKGHIVLYVGPTKISLSNTERMILFREGRFVPVQNNEAKIGVLPFVEASSAQYVVLENPPVDPDTQPARGANSAVPLNQGRKIVVPGPVEFPLWPGQRAEVVDGHRLDQDEYLVVRIYDDTFAEDLPAIGTELIVRGTQRSFYVPRSGLEVVRHQQRYVRKAWRMDASSGLHLRVVAPVEAGEGDQLPPGAHLAGQDIFLRGREGYFFPTESVEVIGRVSAIPLAVDEGIYVRSFDSGNVRIVEGPICFLPDPTREEVLFRPVDPETTALWGVDASETGVHAPAVYVPPSTAVMVVAKDRRDVVTGPCTRVLGYDEDLEVLTLSTGRPKSDDELLSTCFLRVDGNKVSDVVSVETADHVALEVLVSYRVSFTGDAQRWFNVKDYVGLLCDHLSSIIRASARSVPIERFHEHAAGLIRDAVLGPHGDGGREGRHFEENGLWVYDVEVLAVGILDAEVAALLGDAQRLAIVSEIARKREQLRLGDERLREEVSQAIYDARVATLHKSVAHEEAARAAKLAEAHTRLALDEVDTVRRADLEAEAFAIRARARLGATEAENALERQQLEARAQSFRAQMEALQPELVATLRMLGNRALAAELSKNLSPLAILGGESVADVASRLLSRLPLPLGGGDDVGLGGSLLSVLAANDDEAAE